MQHTSGDRHSFHSKDNANALASISQAVSGKEATVEISGSAYALQVLRIKAGTKVTWINKDATKHDAIADDGSFRTKLLGKNESATLTFRKAGVFSYHCGPHPFMKGQIIVEE